MTGPGLPPIHYRELLRRELAADLGDAGDVTTRSVLAPGRRARADVVARREGRVCGIAIAAEAFLLLDPGVEIEIRHGDGSDVAPDAAIARLAGSAAALLAAERTALNLLAHLSGIATATRDLVARVGAHPARVSCTRKTTPGLRALEKYAVRVGGGVNHRFGLYDAVLIKDSHRALAGGVAPAIRAARTALGPQVEIEVEVEDLDQLREALAEGADAVLLDNMSPSELARSVELVAGRALTEASGGVTPETVAEVAASGVDRVSVGWLTHSAPAWDVALDYRGS